VKILIDTHVFLWAILEPHKLSKVAKGLLANSNTAVLVSSATAWEIATKVRIGKLAGGQAVIRAYAKYLARFAADELPIASEHALLAGSFSNGHRDPFDRMLAAQACCSGIPLMSDDKAFREFPVSLVW
jgi:PIN domain nuclease of toxin-antitoxin system